MNNEGMCGFVVFSYIVWLSALDARLCLNAKSSSCLVRSFDRIATQSSLSDAEFWEESNGAILASLRLMAAEMCILLDIGRHFSWPRRLLAQNPFVTQSSIPEKKSRNSWEYPLGGSGSIPNRLTQTKQLLLEELGNHNIVNNWINK
jgi:hypothetical protein